MKEVQKITQKVVVLLLDILMFTWQVVRRVVLPTGNRKGNILSSLLTFFVGLLERIVFFEKSILRRPVVFTHKYVKQGLIIVVGLLFLLSSFEWTIGLPADVVENGPAEVVACTSAAGLARTVTPQRNFSVGAANREVVAARFFIALSARPGLLPVAKKWLRSGVFRI